MKKLFLILAAAAMIFASCSKKKDNTPTPEPTPVTKTVLAGMDASGITLYGDVAYTYTYDADGRMATTTQISDDGELTHTFVWENGELISAYTGNGTANGDIVLSFETSDAPAQALFYLMKYDGDVSELCHQGCFGTLPVHMPSTRSLTVYMNGIPIHTNTSEYVYTVENGRLATCQETKAARSVSVGV